MPLKSIFEILFEFPRTRGHYVPRYRARQHEANVVMSRVDDRRRPYESISSVEQAMQLTQGCLGSRSIALVTGRQMHVGTILLI